MGFEKSIHQLRILHGPVPTCVSEWLIGRPELQDDVERLAHHEAVDAVSAIDVKHFPITRQTGRRNAKVEPPAGDVVENGDAVSYLRWMMEWQQEATGPKPDVLRLHERLGNQEIG